MSNEQQNTVNEATEKGATMVEYALMVALLAIALIAAVTALKGSVSQAYSRSGSTLMQ